MEIVFKLLKILLKNRYVLLILGFGSYYFFSVWFQRWVPYPSVPYNLDSVLYYFVYYAIGNCAFPAVQRLFALQTAAKKWIFAVSGVGAFLYSALVFVGHNILSVAQGVPVVHVFLPILGALLHIWLVFVVSRMLEGFPLLRKIGSDTLYLCGSEYVVKTIMSSLAGVFGLAISFPNPLSAFLYTGILLVLTDRYVVPLEKRFIHSVQKLLFERGQKAVSKSSAE